MKQETNQSAPYSFARCFNAQCLQASKCLRYLITENDTPNIPFITAVSPVCYPEDTNKCPYFHTAERVQVAWGIKRLLKRLPYEDAVSIRKHLIWHFGKTCYYRFYREERYLSPNDQKYIQQVFHNKGIADKPTFDRYTEEYIW
ncbi:hypothetical protein SAMN05444349_10556 [Bacteroides faecichinchillae]|uniref:Uncharacterized protein n=1 Tax=Bacteroides faecichinchillae TaxID=871325 RepID=A0A1M4VNA0_9BACE|nr:DUF6078 family protein [Bacteroides faecichinchillae]THG66415.1 hypothetical protein E5981_10295 [Bacteroides faecichinchillae]SHE70506.1 hypothetical protein SAMN05444349_10556 [Bacteroides faecichinchillae]